MRVSFLSLVETWANALWNPWLLGAFLLVGGWYTLRSGLFQLTPHRWLGTLKRSLRRPSTGGLTQAQALSTALASTIGTGSIAGVATAIFFGGPGAVFWMWVSALLGMMTGFAEKYLAAAFREPAPDGSFQGGPMCYMAKGLKRVGKPLAAAFSLTCVLASLAGGAMVQSNSISTSLHAAAGVAPISSGLLTALAVGVVLLGGIGRVGKVSETLVPLMAGMFLTGGLTAIFLRRSCLPAAFSAILQGAFRPRAAFGGITAALALRYGVARGVFTNEAGLGSSAMAHAAAGGSTPSEEGCWGMVEVLISTLVVCTVTALVILTAGVYSPADALSALADGVIPPEYLGAPLCAASFGVTLGKVGPLLVSVSLLLFAYTSLLGWGYYGERALSFLWGNSRAVPLFRGVFLLCVVMGSLGEVGAVWQLADLTNGLMALPNLTALLLLSPQVLPCISSVNVVK